jgi:WD40 repeat protein
LITMKFLHRTLGIAIAPFSVIASLSGSLALQAQPKKPTPPPASPIVIDSGFVIQQKVMGHSNYANAVAYSSNGKFMASGGWDNKVLVYQLDSITGTGTVVKTFAGYRSAVTTLAFDKEGKWLGSGSKDFGFRVNDVTTGDLVFRTEDHKDVVTAVRFDGGGKFAYTASLDGTLRMYDVAQPLNNMKPKFISYGKPINDFLLSSGTKQLYVVASSSADIEVIDFAKTLVRSYKGHTAGVTCLDLSANKKLMASGSLDKTVIVWDVTTGAVVKKFEGHTWKINSVHFSKDGKYVVSACNDGETRVWNVETGNCVAIFKGIISNAQCAQFSHNNRRIAVVGAMEAQGSNYGVVLYKTPLGWPVVKAPKGGAVGSGSTGKPAVGTVGGTTGTPSSSATGTGAPATPGSTTPITPKRPVTKYEGNVWPPPTTKKK